MINSYFPADRKDIIYLAGASVSCQRLSSHPADLGLDGAPLIRDIRDFKNFENNAVEPGFDENRIQCAVPSSLRNIVNKIR